ncbi:MAG: T9SS type A sorting domain-containing protein [Bacteroidetes bacterium]|nr:T9SS type A sorting domain-containing protein [Bacteroidota bacterium]
MTRWLLLVCLMCLVVTFAFAGSGGKGNPLQNAHVEAEQLFDRVDATTITPDYISPLSRPLVGTYTTLSGYYDYQSNGGAIQHIQVNPANGNIHVIYMLSEDSAAFATSRRTGYAFSTDNGATWNNFNNLRVPSRLSGFPTITLLKGPNAGLPGIANHSTISGTQSTVFIDSPEGAGAFSELNAPPTVALSGALQPIWPNVGGPADGSVVMSASLNTGAAPFYFLRTRTTDFASWANWAAYPDTTGQGGRNPTYANDNGYVGTLLNAGNAGGAWWHVSTNNGETWSANGQNIYPISPPGRQTATDTFRVWVGTDFLWDGNTPLMALNEQNLTSPRNNQGQILFWSQATGFVVVGNTLNTPNVKEPPFISQSNHLNIGWPVIAKSGNTLVIVYQALTNDTASNGLNYGDLFYSRSENNGVTWSVPVNLTNTPDLDERFPSVSRWNPSGFVNLTWQEDPEPGSYVIATPDAGARPSRARQVFYRLPIPPVSVGEGGVVANSFKLSQNYPNPFNPSTKIDYTVAQAGLVSIKVYNLLGQEVATLLNENLSPGSYQVTFDGAKLPSGVYVYKMSAGSYQESKKMVLMK